MSDYTPTYTELEAINLIKRLRNPDLGDSVRNNQDREAAADYIEQVQDVIKALRKGPRQIDLSSCEARVKELEGERKHFVDDCQSMSNRIEQLEIRIEELEALPHYHHPDCNYWKWDWGYSWHHTDCNCDAVAGPPQPPEE